MKKKLVRTLLAVVALIALCVCIWCGWYIWQYYQGEKLGEAMRLIGPDGSLADITLEEIEIPVDFAALHEMNPEIYAWLELPGTDISNAVLQHVGEDQEYYMDHSEDGSYYSCGSVFSQSYNALGFTDPVTVLYGHNIKDSSRTFATLNKFSDAEYFRTHRYICVYLPDRELIYEIFAAYPHSNEHLLLTHDFSDPEQFEAYFNSVFNTRNLKANFLDDVELDAKSDRIITLSTCFADDNRQRYLVQGRLIAEIPGA